MQWRLGWAGGLILAIAWALAQQPAQAVITRVSTLRKELAAEQFIFVAKVEQIDPAKPSMVLTVSEALKGKIPFQRLPVLLNGDREGKKGNHPEQLLKRVAPGSVLVLFANPAAGGNRYTAIAYINGTWFQMVGYAAANNPAVVRWEFGHFEPYFRRMFKGTTAELHQIVIDGLAGTKEPPEPNLKEPPGIGPELKSPPPEKSGALPQRGPLLAVIPTFVVVGPLAVLAALFPAVFGGLILVLRRWMVLLSVASLNSTLWLVHAWLQKYLQESWWGTSTALWSIVTLVSLVGAVWSWRRHRAAPADERADALRPRRSEGIVLALFSLVGLALAGYGAFRHMLLDSPWLQFLAFGAVGWVGALYLLYLRLASGPSSGPSRAPTPEGLMLATLVLVCAGFGAAAARDTGDAFQVVTIPSGPGSTANVNRVRTAPSLVWKFVAGDGTIVAAPSPTPQGVYVAAAHDAAATSRFGTVYCLNSRGKKEWQFPNGGDDEMKQVSLSSPCLAGDWLYVGEGFHEDSDCKLYCLNAKTGKKRWAFETSTQDEKKQSHIESSPCVVSGKVYFGAGDNGVYCLDAETGVQIWNFPGVHVDTSPAVVDGRLYAGTGYGDKYEVFCLNADTGKPFWRVVVDLPVWGSPTVDGGQVLVGLGNGNFVASDDNPRGALLCLDAETGDKVWRFDEVQDAVLTKPAVSADGVVFGSRDGNCYCVDRQGKWRWQYALGSPVVAAPAVSDGVVYVAASGGRVCCLRGDTGAVQWTFEVAKESGKKPELFSSPRVLDGRIYFGAGLDNLINKAAVLYCLEDEKE
jgi:outer membrane protein assembly factor BamB